MPMSRGKMGDQLPPGLSMIGVPNHDLHRSQLGTPPGDVVQFVIAVVRYVLLIVQRLRMTETIRQGQFPRRAIAQRIETEIERAVVHGEFEIYHGTNVHPIIHGLMSFGLRLSDYIYSTA